MKNSRYCRYVVLSKSTSSLTSRSTEIMNGDSTFTICSKMPDHDAQLREELWNTVNSTTVVDSTFSTALEVDILMSLD
jgi:hypothetical protein